jgi:predicted alpha/beta hydrolase family esterase
MRVLILHGYLGNTPDHWQSWLADELRGAGHDVAYPDLPDPDHPRLPAWLDALAPLRQPGDVVVCHSLACCLWLHHRVGGGPPAERALLVAPPLPEPMLDELAGFYPFPLAPGSSPEARVVCSDVDPYNPRGGVATFAEPLQLEADVLPGAGHINPEAGYGPWPAVLSWVLGRTASPT